MKDRQRIKWIDIAKGIAILSVILGHVVTNDHIKEIVFLYHLPIFFVLAGYNIGEGKIDCAYIAKKFDRLMKPYFLTSLFVFLFDILNKCITGPTDTVQVTAVIWASLKKIFFASGTINAMGPVDMGGRIGAIWFLPAMFFGIVLARLILSGGFPTWVKWAFSVSLFVLSTVMAAFLWLPFSILSGLFSLPFIMLGHELSKKNIVEKLRIYHAIPLLLFALAGVFLTPYAVISFARASIYDYFLTTALIIAACLFIIYISKKLEKISVVFSFFGRNSLLLLCIHLVILECGGLLISLMLKGFTPEKADLISRFIQFFLPLILMSVWALIKRFVKNGRAADKPAQKTEPENTVTEQPGSVKGKRDRSVDVMRFILIIMMLMGHSSLDTGLRTLIYSFHMPAFIILSGYFHKDSTKESFGKDILKAVKGILLPYAIFAVIYVIKNKEHLKALKEAILSISFTKRILTGTDMIGPVWFLTMLFMTKLIYMVIARFTKDNLRHAVVLITGLLGIALAGFGFWLPWSIDVALYAVWLYHIGFIIKKYSVFDLIKNARWVYFILSAVLAFFIHTGIGELAIRQYKPYGGVVIAAVAGTLLCYLFSEWITKDNSPVTGVAALGGQGTLYILIVHALFRKEIYAFLSSKIGIIEGSFYNLMAGILIQVVAGILICWIVEKIKRIISKKQEA